MSDFPTSKLLNWYDAHGRDLPWRQTDDPYKVWVSEVMLQQTRVETVIPYYNRFTEALPTVQSLAATSRQQLLKLWEGLGYYSRARNLQDAAKTVSEKWDGRLPENYDELTGLKGVGPYTASAILSIAFNQPYAVVDGNVIRVTTRFFGLEEDIRKQSTKKRVQTLADQCMDRNRPGDFNQALMELGATLCHPSSPECDRCPVSAHCNAYRNAATDRIPYKSSSRKTPHYHIGTGILTDSDGRVLIALRPEDVMLGGLWELPGGKQQQGEDLQTTVHRELKEELNVNVKVGEKFMELKHTYSHFRITLHAYRCRLDPENQQPTPKRSRELRWVRRSELQNYPFPKANKTLTDKLIQEDE